MSVLFTAADILKKCNKEVSTKEVEALVEKNNSKSVNKKCKENIEVNSDLKKMINTVATIKQTEDATNRIDKLDAAIDTLNNKTKHLRKSMNSALFSTEVDLMNVCGAATKDAIYMLNGTSSVDPVASAKAFRNALKIMFNSYQKKKDVIDNADVNELLFDEEDEDDPDDGCDLVDEYFEFFEDEDIQESKRFAANLGFMDQQSGTVSKWSAGKRTELFGDRAKELTDVILPAVWESTNCIEFMISLVNVAKLEKEKKPRTRQQKEEKPEKVKLVKLTDRKETIQSQSEEVSIMRELDHVHKSLRNALRKRKADSIPYYEFIMNPTDFARTVENMFYVSYLIRDNKAFLEDDNGVPYLKCAKLMQPEAVNQAKNVGQYQGIAQLSFKHWLDLCNVFKTPCIEHKDI
ncbi:unnamed protein product [Caenorhabditis angaria]|uniref:Non-structural maintenance of chromosomes element 4 n=1 Tax=Caenorhabditis angaria TaxID=860376 RepID=A0A9P1N2L7_9PELO|nr:unnamed protein product [Caenorhabditis angaria]